MNRQTYERLKNAANIPFDGEATLEIQRHGGLEWLKVERPFKDNSCKTKFLTFVPTRLGADDYQNSILTIFDHAYFSFLESSMIEVIFRNSFEGMHEVVIRMDLFCDDWDFRFSSSQKLGLLGERQLSGGFQPYCFFESALESLSLLPSPWSDLSTRFSQAWDRYKKVESVDVLPVPSHYLTQPKKGA